MWLWASGGILNANPALPRDAAARSVHECQPKSNGLSCVTVQVIFLRPDVVEEAGALVVLVPVKHVVVHVDGLAVVDGVSQPLRQHLLARVVGQPQLEEARLGRRQAVFTLKHAHKHSPACSTQTTVINAHLCSVNEYMHVCTFTYWTYPYKNTQLMCLNFIIRSYDSMLSSFFTNNSNDCHKHKWCQQACRLPWVAPVTTLPEEMIWKRCGMSAGLAGRRVRPDTKRRNWMRSSLEKSSSTRHSHTTILLFSSIPRYLAIQQYDINCITLLCNDTTKPQNWQWCF